MYVCDVLHHIPQVLDTKWSWLLWGSQLSLQNGEFLPSLLQRKAWKCYFGKILKTENMESI